MSLRRDSSDDFESKKGLLASWIESRAPELGAVRIEKFYGNANGSGLSNETAYVVASHAEGRSKWAVRFAPADRENAMFLDYDIPRQFRIMEALYKHSDVPVTPPRWLELDSTLLGSPFFFMDFVEGDVPADMPPWQIEGFLVQGAYEDRARVWWSIIEQIAKIGRVDWRAAGLGFLAEQQNGCGSFHELINYFERVFRSGRIGSPPFPDAERAIQWLRANAPENVDLCLCWGDVKPGNVIFQNYQPVALMDWEMACLGAPEMDLANFLVYQNSHENPINPAYARPRLPGFGSNAETMTRFAQLIGRPLRDFDFYWVFTAFRYLALAQRYINVLVKSGTLPREQAEAAKLLGGGLAEPMMAVVDGRRSPVNF